MKASHPSFVITLSCPDRIGIVADVAAFLVAVGGNILESAQHGDAGNGHFFLRTLFESTRDIGREDLEAAFAPIAERYGMNWALFDAARRTPTLIMVSRFGHCLNDLLFRAGTGAVPIEVKAVVSNHRDF